MVENYINPTNLPTSNTSYGRYDVPQMNFQFPFQQQRAENQELLQGYTQAINAQPTVSNLYDRYSTRYNLPQLREAEQRYLEAGEGAMSQLRALPETVAQGSQESILTQGQKDRVVAKQAEPISEAIDTYGRAAEATGRRAQQGEALAQQGVAMDMAQQEKELSPWLMKYDDKNIMQAREFSGFTTQAQLELNRLLSNAANGLSWDNAEAQRAHSLLMQEEAFQNSLEMMEKQTEVALEYWE